MKESNTEFINPYEKIIDPLTGKETEEYQYPDKVKEITDRIQNEISSEINKQMKQQIKQKK